MTEWITNISNLLSVLSAAGLLGGGVWMYRRENRRIKQAEAARAEADLNIIAAHEWKEIAEHREQKLEIRDKQITGLFDQIGQWRDRCNEKDMQIHRLELQLESQKIRLCNRRGCPVREPQSGY
ncbi:MAG: hypothetical protein K2G93_02110 [Rikenella sp.]|nr:hypothetical protein [Rikenella sp.]